MPGVETGRITPGRRWAGRTSVGRISALLAAVVEKSRGEAIPVLDPAVADVEARADDDLVAAGAHLFHLLQGGEDASGLATAAALRRLGLDGPNIAVEHRPEALDDVARVGEAAADEVGKKRGCVGSECLGWLHGAVSVLPMGESGGWTPSPGRPTTVPLTAVPQPLGDGKRISGEITGRRRDGNTGGRGLDTVW